MVTPRGQDDQGPAWPLAAALAADDQRAFAEAIRTAQVAVPAAPGAGADALLVMPGEHGERVLLAFSHPDALRRWDGEAPVGTVRGVDLAATATGAGADLVYFDVAGPAPVRIGTRALQDLVDGVVPGSSDGSSGGPARLVGALEVREDPEFAALLASRTALLGLPASTRLLALRRRTAGGAVRAVIVDSDDLARRLADALFAALPAGEPADIMPVERSVFDELASSYPSALVSIQ